jgi:tripartite-type tricarboxylate transporter receptor subunit TctC
VRRALADESVQALYARLGLVAVGSTPEALALMLRSDVERYAGLIRQGHLRMR